jgi:hypothetical protein
MGLLKMTSDYGGLFGMTTYLEWTYSSKLYVKYNFLPPVLAESDFSRHHIFVRLYLWTDISPLFFMILCDIS